MRSQVIFYDRYDSEAKDLTGIYCLKNIQPYKQMTNI